MGREAKINKKLTRKQTTFVKEMVNGRSATQAAMVAYDVSNPKTASVIGSQNLNKLSVSEALEEALRSQGLTLDVIAVNIGEIANAKPEKVSGDTVLKANVELLKLQSAYPGSKNMNVNLSLKGNIRDMTFQEAKKALQELRASNDELLKEMEENPHTTHINLQES